VRLANPAQFVAQARCLVDEAFAGDVIGVFDPGIFEIGDTLTGGTKFEFEKIPSFAPEYFSRLVSKDPMRRKQLTKGIEQLAKEGTVQLYRHADGRSGELILGAVGQLQMEVTVYRLKEEYSADVRLEPLAYRVARWVSPKPGQSVDLNKLQRVCTGLVVLDIRERPVVLFEHDWSVRFAQERAPEAEFTETAQGVVMRK
jgi:peptide chain release factor 3